MMHSSGFSGFRMSCKMLRMAAGISTLPRERLTGDLSDPPLPMWAMMAQEQLFRSHISKSLASTGRVGAEHIHLGTQERLEGVKYDHHSLTSLDSCFHLRAVEGQVSGIAKEIALVQVAAVRFDTTAQNGQVILHGQDEHRARAFNGDTQQRPAG